jgi:hypothetical protein
LSDFLVNPLSRRASPLTSKIVWRLTLLSSKKKVGRTGAQWVTVITVITASNKVFNRKDTRSEHNVITSHPESGMLLVLSFLVQSHLCNTLSMPGDKEGVELSSCLLCHLVTVHSMHPNSLYFVS